MRLRMIKVVLTLLIIFNWSCFSQGKEQQRTLATCTSAEEGFEAINTKLNEQASFRDVEFLSDFNRFDETCQALIQTHPEFQGFLNEVIRLSEQAYSAQENNLNFDLTSLERLHSMRGTELSEEFTSSVNERMEEARNNCGPIDRRSEMPPVRNQGNVNWCYAYTAADLVGHRIGEHISAFDMALNYNGSVNVSLYSQALFRPSRPTAASSNQEGEQPRGIIQEYITRLQQAHDRTQSVFDREYGFSQGAIEATRFMGFCREADLPSDTVESRSLAELLENITAFEDEVEALESRDNADYLALAFCMENAELMGQFLPGVPLSEVAEATRSLSTSAYFRQIVNRQCENRIQFNQESVFQTSTQFPDGELTTQLDQVLNSGQVVGILYSMGMISHNGSGNHVSSVVGRRWDENSRSCRYLVRNSWGEGCHHYTSNIECNPQTDSGHFWVSREDLNENLHRITHF